MISLEQAHSSAVAKAPAPKSTLPSIAARPVPMPGRDVAKVKDLIDVHFDVKNDDQYGYVSVIEDGKAVREEYDIVGQRVVYAAKKDIPQALREALVRPALREHLTYHLGRLAAHRRDTRGREAIEVVLEDLSNDLRGVSEWAVIMACEEMRKKNSTWFPNSGEIIKIVRDYHTMIEAINFNFKQLAAPGEKTKRKLDNYYVDPKENPLRRELCDFIVSKGGEDYFNLTAPYSNYQLEGLARSKYGWAKEAA